MTTTLIIPGLKSSGPTHWQSWLQTRISGAKRVEQSDWNTADIARWSARIRHDIVRSSGRIFLIAHSFGALAAVQAANDHADRIAGILLVAPADPELFGVGRLLPENTLSFPSVVVASTNDPWMSIDQAGYWADLWGSEFVNLGDVGHINADSGFGPWPAGLMLYERLARAANFSASFAGTETFRSMRARRLDRQHERARRPLSVSRGNGNGDRYDLQRAAALLEDAGWLVTPPRQSAHAGRVT